MTDVTRIINAIEKGEAGAAEELLPLVYEFCDSLIEFVAAEVLKADDALLVDQNRAGDAFNIESAGNAVAPALAVEELRPFDLILSQIVF